MAGSAIGGHSEQKLAYVYYEEEQTNVFISLRAVPSSLHE
jgi:hypothetical protein